MIRYYENIDISERNSFHVRQTAKRLVEFDRAEELPEIFAKHGTEDWYVISGGNNILFTKDIEPLLITPCDSRIEVISESDSSVRVKVGAGVEWDDLVAWSVERGLWGIENLSLIPGKAGAAPVQNIGAYGVEAKDTIRSVEMYFVEGGNFVTLAAEHCAFGYRESVFKHSLKGRVVITAIEIELSKVANPRLGYGDVIREVEARGGATLANIRDAICSIRRSKLPDTAVLGNAGSFFKNPIIPLEDAEALQAQYENMPIYPAADSAYRKLAAGWLIDQAGMKGYRNGNVGVHTKQALVLVNYGGATGHEVINLAKEVQHRVKEKFGIAIEPEVNIL